MDTILVRMNEAQAKAVMGTTDNLDVFVPIANAMLGLFMIKAIRTLARDGQTVAAVMITRKLLAPSPSLKMARDYVFYLRAYEDDGSKFGEW